MFNVEIGFNFNLRKVVRNYGVLNEEMNLSYELYVAQIHHPLNFVKAFMKKIWKKRFSKFFSSYLSLYIILTMFYFK